MKHMSFEQSEILQEFGRIMQERDGLKKVAQAVNPLNDDEKKKLQHFLGELQKSPSNGPGMERWMHRLKGQAEPYLASVHQALAQRYSLWSQGKDAAEISAVPLPASAPAVAATPAPVAPVPPRTAAISQRAKTADQKSYDVTAKEDMIHAAHPKPAKVCGDELVENKNEQQAADLAVARKSAQLKSVLVALYKLAKRLEAEKNEEAYSLVKETFLSLSKSLKK